MKPAEVGEGRAHRGRMLAGRTTKPGSGLCVTASKAILLDDAQTNRVPHRVGRAVSGRNRIPVIFWVLDGSCYEGTTPYVDGQVVFVESERVVPVGTELTISLTPPNNVSANRSVALGTVVWHCPSKDHFKNRKGFGVCLQGGWRQAPGLIGTESPKEAT